MKFAIALVALTLSLTSCAVGTSKQNALILPDDVAYTKEEKKQAAAELATYGPYMPIVAGKMMPDYGMVRKQIRAAKKIIKKY